MEPTKNGLETACLFETSQSGARAIADQLEELYVDNYGRFAVMKTDGAIISKIGFCAMTLAKSNLVKCVQDAGALVRQALPYPFTVSFSHPISKLYYILPIYIDNPPLAS